MRAVVQHIVVWQRHVERIESRRERRWAKLAARVTSEPRGGVGVVIATKVDRPFRVP